MNTRSKNIGNKKRTIANTVSQKLVDGGATLQFLDNHPEVNMQKKLQEIANSSQLAKQLRSRRFAIGVQFCRIEKNF